VSWRTGRWPVCAGHLAGRQARGLDQASLQGWAGIVAMNDLAAALSAFARNAAAPAQNNHSVAVRVAGSRDGRAFITADMVRLGTYSRAAIPRT
jgi:hypothetical protein